MEGNGEEVNDFLMRIRELGNRRDKEDDEIARKLEADILAGREARRARRDGTWGFDLWRAGGLADGRALIPGAVYAGGQVG